MFSNHIYFALASAMLVASASTCSAFTPYFFDTSPETTIIDLNAGQTSFVVTGSAYDPDSRHTVDFFTIGLQPFMQFETMPGNPGSFRIHAENLSGLQYGGYLVDVIAFDDATPQPYANSYSFGIGIVPEPSSLSLGFLLLAVGRRRH